MALLTSGLILVATLVAINRVTAIDSDCESGCPVYIRAPIPVCGDGREYMDKCRARCAGSKVITRGPCGKSCLCPELYKPVCGDGKTYPNVCFARCAGAKEIRYSPCRLCICTRIYRPVCGKNGVTYSNSCLAHCAGVRRYTQGPCCRPCVFRCTNEYKPVCADGVTYRNRCLTLCLCPKPKKIVPGQCRRDMDDC